MMLLNHRSLWLTQASSWSSPAILFSNSSSEQSCLRQWLSPSTVSIIRRLGSPSTESRFSIRRYSQLRMSLSSRLFQQEGIQGESRSNLSSSSSLATGSWEWRMVAWRRASSRSSMTIWAMAWQCLLWRKGSKAGRRLLKLTCCTTRSAQLFMSRQAFLASTKRGTEWETGTAAVKAWQWGRMCLNTNIILSRCDRYCSSYEQNSYASFGPSSSFSTFSSYSGSIMTSSSSSTSTTSPSISFFSRSLPMPIDDS